MFQDRLHSLSLSLSVCGPGPYHQTLRKTFVAALLSDFSAVAVVVVVAKYLLMTFDKLKFVVGPFPKMKNTQCVYIHMCYKVYSIE